MIKFSGDTIGYGGRLDSGDRFGCDDRFDGGDRFGCDDRFKYDNRIIGGLKGHDKIVEPVHQIFLQAVLVEICLEETVFDVLDTPGMKYIFT